MSKVFRMSGKRLVIFGCGYVGRMLAETSVSQGFEVWIQSRNRASLEAVGGIPAGRRIVGNLHDDSWHEKLPGHWDAAINLVSSAGDGLEGYRLSYLEGNRSILNWAGDARVDRLIYTSATSVYPQSDGAWVSETDVPAEEDLSPSGAILRESERMILRSEAVPLKIVARLGGIYGPGRHLYLNRILENASSIPGDGSSWLNLIYLKDIVSGLMTLLNFETDASSEIFNLVDNEPTRKQDIVDWLARRLGRPAIPFAGGTGGGRSARRMVAGKLPNRRVSNRKMRELTDWEADFPSFREGYGEILQSLA